MSKMKTGRASVFRGKVRGDSKYRVQGVLTPRGKQQFEAQRSKLGKLAELPHEKVSDADVIEFLSRGEEETRKYLARSV